MLYQLLQSYTSLCGIYATQFGGLSRQTSPDNHGDWIKELWDGNAEIKDITAQIEPDEKGFIRLSNYLACKAHALCRADHINLPRYSLEAENYSPYEKMVYQLIIRSQKLSTPIPSNLFNIFMTMRIISIVDITLKDTEIPVGLASCKSLEVLIWSNIRGLAKVPKDVLQAPKLTTVYIHNCPITSLDFDWPTGNNIKSLTLKGLSIDTIPAGIGNLTGLEELNLDYNPITTLPKELEKLISLRQLSVKGWCIIKKMYMYMSILYLEQGQTSQNKKNTHKITIMEP